MHLAVVTETYPPEINGVAHTMRHLVEGLAARGHRVRLVRPRQRGERAARDQTAPTLVPGLPIPGYHGLRFGLPVYWRLRRQWRHERPDLVYIATQGPLGHAALAAARDLGVAVVTGFHTQFHQYSRHYGLGLLTGPIVAALRRFHNRSQATLVPTATLCERLGAAGFDNVAIFGRGVDIERFSPRWRDPELRRAWGCAADDLAVLYVGRIAAEKNLALACAAFEAIRTERPGARFVLVGDGPELARLRRTAPDYVCTGAKTGQALSAHYASGDLFLFPSETETFGNVVTEAMASGLPVIAYDDAAAHTHIDPWRNGVTVPLGERDDYLRAAREAARDHARLRRMGEAARHDAEGMSWERVLEGLEEQLREVIHRQCRSGGLSCRCGYNT
ncbi:glycosyltransferase family 1 protein [Marichromatium bheemlicum]|uniref:Glycosyltransferase family 1 protein n=1 Tax=Marichromatium bheemlicum TaxID=365339 RepID=A0ABX1IC97_9GAMM|nr:glycosyltransferase family 1 protein [Marichromatium bheemlicum]